MSNILKAACIQMNAGPEIEKNIEDASELIHEAASKGARLITTPENTSRMRIPAPGNIKTALTQDNHPGVPHFSNLAKELNVWILAGSMPVKISETKVANRSFLFNDKGDLTATYDKIHMFDVDLPTGESHRESDRVQPGEKLSIAQTPWGKIGLTVCYDVRFSYLFRALAQAGAGIITVPAAFTVPTGKAHWEILLRARAIETGSFILAPAQTGEHEGGRKTWGHSLIIGPWGEIIAEAGNEVGIIMGDLDLTLVTKARTAIPALKHDRQFSA